MRLNLNASSHHKLRSNFCLEDSPEGLLIWYGAFAVALKKNFKKKGNQNSKYLAPWKQFIIFFQLANIHI